MKTDFSALSRRENYPSVIILNDMMAYNMDSMSPGGKKRKGAARDSHHITLTLNTTLTKAGIQVSQ